MESDEPIVESDEPIVRARDLMERAVITVTPETRLLDVHRLFVEEEIHGAPVVGEDTLVRGVVSTLDLLRLVRDEFEPGAGATATTYFRDELPYSGPDWLRMPEDFQDRMQELTASDAMARDLVTVGPDATVDDIARKMLEHRVHRVLVCEDRVLLGVVSAFDLLRVVACSISLAPQPGRPGAGSSGSRRPRSGRSADSASRSCNIGPLSFVRSRASS